MGVFTKLFQQGRVRARVLGRTCLGAWAVEPEGESVQFRVLKSGVICLGLEKCLSGHHTGNKGDGRIRETWSEANGTAQRCDEGAPYQGESSKCMRISPIQCIFLK